MPRGLGVSPLDAPAGGVAGAGTTEFAGSASPLGAASNTVAICVPGERLVRRLGALCLTDHAGTRAGRMRRCPRRVAMRQITLVDQRVNSRADVPGSFSFGVLDGSRAAGQHHELDVPVPAMPRRGSRCEQAQVLSCRSRTHPRSTSAVPPQLGASGLECRRAPSRGVSGNLSMAGRLPIIRL